VGEGERVIPLPFFTFRSNMRKGIHPKMAQPPKIPEMKRMAKVVHLKMPKLTTKAVHVKRSK
jgi:hypothetical protein